VAQSNYAIAQALGNVAKAIEKIAQTAQQQEGGNQYAPQEQN
jgi:hypothetical protein